MPGVASRLVKIPIITLTTDFGTRDPYVASMKASILRVAPEARIVDISNEIAPQDILEAAFVLKNAAPYFPAGTVHVVVVDPGVGTARRPVAVRMDDMLFVGPDNGVLPLTFDERPADQVVTLDRSTFWRTERPSSTFHGRDIFASVAAHLAMGTPLGEIGSAGPELQKLRWGLPISDEQGIRGWIVHVDHFGNCISNIPRHVFATLASGRDPKFYVGSAILRGIHTTYADVGLHEPVVLFGSSELLEIAVSGGNASELLSIRKGDPIDVVFIETRQDAAKDAS